MTLRWLTPFLLVTILATSVETGLARQAKDYKSAAEAYEVGATFLRQKNNAKGQEALEAALTLSPDAKLKGKIYRALLIPYDADKDFTKFLSAMDYVIRFPTSQPERSNNRRDVLGFLQERKKEKEGAERYEAMLKKDPKDEVVLYILSGIQGDLLGDAKRAAELTDQLAKVIKDKGGAGDVLTTVTLAQEYVKSRKFKEGAELYEKAAGMDDKQKAHYLKEAAGAWVKAEDKDKARAAAKASAALGFDNKNKLLAHFWNRGLGEVFFDTGDYQLAVQHLEKAIELTTIEGYRKDCQKKLEMAKEKMK
jgi:tetratricopeptide (TPR) repeat protein